MFINDKISQLKTPQVLSKTKCSVDSHNKLLASFKPSTPVKAKLGGTPASSFILKSCEEGSLYFDVLILAGSSDFYSRKNVVQTQLDILTCYVTLDENDAFINPDEISENEFVLTYTIQQATVSPATMYHTNGSTLRLVHTDNLKTK